MKIVTRFVIAFIVLVVLAGGAAAGLFIYNNFQEALRHQEMLARQQAAARTLESLTVELPWLMPVPAATANTPPAITFRFMDQEHTIRPEANYRIAYGAATADRIKLWNDLWDELWEDTWFDDLDEAEALNEGLRYDSLTFEPQMDHAIESVLVQLREIRDERDLSNDEYIELIVKFVQSIPYCDIHGDLDLYPRPVGCPRTPIQVLMDGTGDCDEVSMLLAALLHREDYPVSLLLFVPEQHMALGLRVDGEGYRGTGYAIVEATSFSYISEVPENLGDAGVVTLESMPLVLSVGGEIENPMPYYSAEALAQVERILDVRNRAEVAADNRFAYIERTPMSNAEFNRQRAMYEACFVPLNRMFPVYPDPTGQINTIFMDRAEAIAWIDQNAWWE